MKMIMDFSSSVKDVEIEYVTFQLQDGRIVTPWWNESTRRNNQLEAWIAKNAFRNEAAGQYEKLTLDDLRGAKVEEISIYEENGTVIDHFEISAIAFKSYGMTMALENVSCDNARKTWRIPVEWTTKTTAFIELSAQSYEEALALMDAENARKRMYARKSNLISYIVNGKERLKGTETASSNAGDLPKYSV